MHRSIFATIVWTIIVVLCSPFRLSNHVSKKHDQERRQGFRRQRGLRPDKLPRRRRTLTVAPKAKFRETSPFLAVLPAEIRQLILQYCLAGNQYHLRIVKERLHGIRCASMTPRVCNGPGSSRGCQVSEMQGAALAVAPNCLAILQTCRAIYFDAIAMLYSQNTFAVKDSDCIEFLPRLFLPQRSNSIRFLRFRWFYDGDPPFVTSQNFSRKQMRFKNMIWTRVWQNISQMQGLRDLRVELFISGPAWESLTSDMADAVVDPIRAVTIPDFFELTIPIDTRAETSPWNDLPCRIRSSSIATQD